MTQSSSTTTTSATATTTRRYEPLLKIASGGTASVYVGSAVGALGFRQLVAIKRPHAHLADDPTFCAALVEEARIASRLHHANLVDVRDVEVDESGIQLVMDYVEGASLSELIRSWAKEPPSRAEAVALRIVLDACEGLRALHELRGDDDAPLGLVHRDVSPANVLVGLDGVARIADFGLAKPLLAVERTTSEGALRGKLGYMAPEYIRGKSIDARIDVFAMGIVLWEVLSRKRLFRGENDGDTLDRVQTLSPPALAELMPQLGPAGAALDVVIARALAKDPADRLPTIAALSAELEKVIRAHDLGATSADVREAFAPSLKAHLDDRRRRVQSATSQPPGAPIPSQPPPPVSISPVSVASGSGQSPAMQTASTSSPAPAPSPTQAPSSQPASNAKKRPALLALGAAVVLSAIAGAVVLFTGTKETAASGAAPAPHTVASEARPLAIEPRARVASSEDDDDATASGAASASGPHGGARPRPRPRPKASVEEPGNKAPRPNPYASPPSR